MVPEGQIEDRSIGWGALDQAKRALRRVGGANSFAGKLGQPVLKHQGNQGLVVEHEYARHKNPLPLRILKQMKAYHCRAGKVVRTAGSCLILLGQGPQGGRQMPWVLLRDLRSGGSPSLVPHAKTTLALGAGLMVLAGVAAIFMAVRASELDRLVAETFETRSEAQRLLSSLQDAETGQRGFLLTLDETYLAPFHFGEQAIPSLLAGLMERISGNPEQLQHLNAVRGLAQAKLNELRQTIDLAHQGQLPEALGVVKTHRGKELMDDIRVQLDAFSAEVFERLGARLESARALRQWLLAFVCVSLALSLVLSALLLFAMIHALEALRARNAELDSELKLRRDTEDTLRQSQKLTAIGELTGGIAHDFNNLLTIILGNMDTIQRRLAGVIAGEHAQQLAARLVQPVELALRGARSAAQLTQRLLAFARKQPLQPVSLDLNRLISGMSDLLRRTLGERIDVEIIAAGGLWTAIADPNQVENAMLNLCVNARDAMPDGGRLTIETGNAYLDEAYTRQFDDVAPRQYVLLGVTDTGTGIAPDIMQRIFEPFFTTKAPGEGSGLGLAMVHGFVKQSGGHIRIYSELGHGTTVKIYLPRLVRSEHARAAPAARPNNNTTVPDAASGETVLLVEDNDGVRGYARSALEELGYKVLEAADATKALRLFDAAARVDLVFTDVVLPGGNGRELADSLAKKRPGIPILFTTGYTRNAIVHRNQLDADVHLINKPYTQQSLARKIRELLDTREAEAAT